MKLIQFTDIHLTAPGDLIYGRDPNINFSNGLKHCMRHHRDAEAIIISGDLTDKGEAINYRRLKGVVDKIPIPVYLTIGNHDNRDHFAAVFPDHLDENGFAQAVFPLSNGVGIALDTRDPDAHPGQLCDIRLAWLTEKLKRVRGPVYLFMHHHPIKTHLERMDRFMLLNDRAFGEVIAPHRDKIAHIFFGHCHLPISGSLHGIPVTGSRGPNQNGWPDFKNKRVLRGADVLQAYTVIIAEDHAVTVHMVEFTLKDERI